MGESDVKSSPSGNTYDAADFDASTFFVYFFAFLIPILALATASLFLLRKGVFQFSRIKKILARYEWIPSRKELLLVWWLWIILLIALPIFLTVLWGVLTIFAVKPPVIGCTVLFAGLLFLLCAHTLLLFVKSGFQTTRVFRISRVIEFSLLGLFAAALVLVHDSFTFYSVTALFLGANTILLICFVYMKQARRDHALFEWWLRGKKESDMQKAENEKQEEKQKEFKKKGETWLNSPIKHILEMRYIRLLLMYLGSVAFLLVYAIIISSEFNSKLGWIIFSGLVVLDGLVLLLQATRALRNPWTVSVLSIIIRAILIIAGMSYWFIGLSFAFFFFGLFLVQRILDFYYPTEQKESVITFDIPDSDENDVKDGDEGGDESGKEKDAKGERGESENDSKPKKDESKWKSYLSKGTQKGFQTINFLHQKAFRHIYVVCLSVLSIMFVILLLMVRVEVFETDEWSSFGDSFDLHHNFKQTLFGYLALFFVWVFLFLGLTLRIYKTENGSVFLVNQFDWKKVPRKSYVFALIGWLLAILCGFVILVDEGTWIVFWIACFVPVILVTMFSFYRKWIHNEYDVFYVHERPGAEEKKNKKTKKEKGSRVAPAPTSEPKPAAPAAGRAGPEEDGAKTAPQSRPLSFLPTSKQMRAWWTTVSSHNYSMMLRLGLVVSLIILLGLLLAWTVEPYLFGILIALGGCILLASFYLIVKFNHTLMITPAWIVLCVLTFVLLIPFGILCKMYLDEMTSSSSGSTWLLVYALLIYVDMCLILVARGYAHAKGGYKRNQVPLIVASAFTLFMIPFIAISAWMTVFNVFGMILFIIFIMFLILGFVAWKARSSRKSRRATLWKVIIASILGTLLFIGLIIGVAFGHPFLGFSIAVWVLVIALWMISARQHLSVQRQDGSGGGSDAVKNSILVYSETVFPVYEFDVEQDVLISSSSASAALFISFGVLFMWGVSTVIVYSVSIGMFVIMSSLIIAILFYMDRRRASAISFQWVTSIVPLKTIRMIRRKAYGKYVKEDINLGSEGSDVESGGKESEETWDEEIQKLETSDPVADYNVFIDRIDFSVNPKSIHDLPENVLSFDRLSRIIEKWEEKTSYTAPETQRYRQMCNRLLMLDKLLVKKSLSWHQYRAYCHCLLIAAGRFHRKQRILELGEFLRENPQFKATEIRDLLRFREDEREKVIAAFLEFRKGRVKQKKENEKKRKEEEKAGALRLYCCTKEREYSPEEQDFKDKVAVRMDKRKRDMMEKMRSLIEEYRKIHGEGVTDEDLEVDDDLQLQIALIRMKAEIDSVIEECKERGTPFCDPDFPANESSIFMDEKKPTPKAGLKSVAKWKRISEISPKPQLFIDGANPGDVIQGGLGDCWFLSALSVIAVNHERVKALFLYPTVEEHGVFGVRFFKDGLWMSVIIDDRIPVTGNGKPAFVDSRVENEFWMMLMEKAFAKVHGSYEAIEAGKVHLGLEDLTGGAGMEIQLSKTEDDISSGNLWKRLTRYQKQGYLLGAGSPAGTDTDVSDFGIVQGHAYSVLDVREISGNCLMRLRNPWGETEWSGDWSDSSDRWTKMTTSQLRHTDDEEDGDFWMSYDDFVRHYESIYVCKLFDASWKRCLVRSEWVAGSTAGGRYNLPTGKNNPQFHLTIEKPSSVFIVLEQEEVRGRSDRAFHHICLMLLDMGGKRVGKVRKTQLVGFSGSYLNTRAVTVEMDLVPLQTPWTILPSTYQPDLEASFRVIAFAQCKVTVVPIDPSVEAV
eukprot:TRINITY_DN5505_c0_g1_i3.p1 TRINITY_DN5505_c0_g1~~TRINITY_DN5505_c0_g1_i3.p1  ORF type:complete len:1778 (-),score=493.56 TRINITY_DN5505_c0_g1_i3:1948-7179(-)